MFCLMRPCTHNFNGWTEVVTYSPHATIIVLECCILNIQNYIILRVARTSHPNNKNTDETALQKTNDKFKDIIKKKKH